MDTDVEGDSTFFQVLFTAIWEWWEPEKVGNLENHPGVPS
jgi:hypothetical protein